MHLSDGTCEPPHPPHRQVVRAPSCLSLFLPGDNMCIRPRGTWGIPASCLSVSLSTFHRAGYDSLMMVHPGDCRPGGWGTETLSSLRWLPCGLGTLRSATEMHLTGRTANQGAAPPFSLWPVFKTPCRISPAPPTSCHSAPEPSIGTMGPSAAERDTLHSLTPSEQRGLETSSLTGLELLFFV